MQLIEISTTNLIADLPKFVEPLQNVTIPIGREAVFSCSIENLQTYKVRAHMEELFVLPSIGLVIVERLIVCWLGSNLLPSV